MTPHAIRLVAGMMNAGKDKGVMLKAADRIAELEAERDAAYKKGMERAADIAAPYNPAGSWGTRIAKAIRKEIEK